MAEHRKHTLYANPSQTRFYWIPDGVTLPAGTYALRSLTGARIEVDEAAATPYKITEDRAKELTRDVVSVIAQRAGTFLSGLGAMMQEVAKKAAEPRPETQEDLPFDAAAAEEEPVGDPDRALERLKKAWAGLQASAADLLATGKDVDAATRERVHKLAEMAGKNLDAAEEGVDEIRGKVREMLANAEVERRLDEATRRLRDLADELGEAFQGKGNRPDESTPSGDNRPSEE